MAELQHNSVVKTRTLAFAGFVFTALAAPVAFMSAPPVAHSEAALASPIPSTGPTLSTSDDLSTPELGELATTTTTTTPPIAPPVALPPEPVPPAPTPDNSGVWQTRTRDNDGSPTTWRSCAIKYTINFASYPSSLTPSQIETIIAEEAALITSLSGNTIQFVYAGPTSARVDPFVDPTVWGGPVVFHFQNVGHLGATRSDSYVTDGHRWHVSDAVYVDPYRVRSEGEMRDVVSHELGHVIGLDHPENSFGGPGHSQHMATSDRPSVWGAGDIAGMQAIGARQQSICQLP